MKPQTEKSYRESGIQPVGLKSEGLTLNLRATCSTKIVHSRQYVVRSSDGVQFIGEIKWQIFWICVNFYIHFAWEVVGLLFYSVYLVKDLDTDAMVVDPQFRFLVGVHRH